LGEDELVVARSELESVRDRLYVLACAVDDVDRDADATADEAEVREALAWLLDAAKQAINAVPSPEREPEPPKTQTAGADDTFVSSEPPVDRFS
jgi:hypothetical protein